MSYKWWKAREKRKQLKRFEIDLELQEQEGKILEKFQTKAKVYDAGNQKNGIQIWTRITHLIWI